MHRLSPRLENRTGRIISVARVTLALFFLIASRLSLDGPAAFPRTTFAVAAAYVAIAVFLLILTWSNWWLEHRLKLPSHVVDLAFFLALDLSTGIYVSSPFFAYYLFLLLAAAMKWGWRGALLTAIAAVLLFAGSTMFGILTQSIGPDQYPRSIIRAGYLLALTVMIGWFGMAGPYRGRELPEFLPEQDLVEPPARAALEHFRECLRAGGAALVWWESDEPWLRLSTCAADGAYHEERIAPDAYDGLVAPELADQAFLFDLPKGRILCFDEAGERIQLFRDAIQADLARRLSLRSGLHASVHGQAFNGHLVAWNIHGMNANDLVLARRLGADISRAFDRTALLWSSLQTAEGQARLEVARDLHDSVAQILAGTAMKLKGVQKGCSTGQDIAAEIQAIEDDLVVHQRYIYDFIRELREPSADARRVDLGAALALLIVELRRQWQVNIRFTGNGAPSVSRSTVAEILHMAREAIANAVRHGGASEIVLNAETLDGHFRLASADNGSGFGETGRFEDTELWERQLGPRSIHERVRKLGGAIQLVSSRSGALLEIDLPLEGEAL